MRQQRFSRSTGWMSFRGICTFVRGTSRFNGSYEQRAVCCKAAYVHWEFDIVHSHSLLLSISTDRFRLWIHFPHHILVENILFAVEALFRSSAVNVIVCKTCNGDGGFSWPSSLCTPDSDSLVLCGDDVSALIISNVKDSGVPVGDSSSTGSLNGFW